MLPSSVRSREEFYQKEGKYTAAIASPIGDTRLGLIRLVSYLKSKHYSQLRFMFERSEELHIKLYSCEVLTFESISASASSLPLSDAFRTHLFILSRKHKPTSCIRDHSRSLSMAGILF